MSATLRRWVWMGAGVLALAVVGAPPAGAASAPATAPAVRGPSPKAIAPHMMLPFIEDDYGKALAEARRLKIPIFIEAWAPW